MTTAGARAVVGRAYGQIAWRMGLTTLVLALVPFVGVGTAIYFYFAHLNQDQLRGILRSRAEGKAEAIALFLAERTATLEVLAHGARLEDLVKPGQLRAIFNTLNQRSRSFVDLGVINAEGDHLVYVGPYKLRHKNYRNAAWFKRTMLQGVSISDVFLGYREVPHFVIAVKRQAAEGKSWILRATIDSAVFSRLVRSAQVGTSGDAYLINRGGRFQTPPRFGGPVLSASGLDVKLISAGVSVVDRRGPNGSDLLTAFAWLHRPDWLLVIDQDPRESLGPLSTARNVELFVLGLGSLLIAAAVFFLIRLFVRQLEAGDRERAALDAQMAHSARLASLGRMAAGVAHEINNPLATIGELAGDLLDVINYELDPPPPRVDEFRDNLTKIEKQIERARLVTHRMLSFARRMEPRIEAVDVGEVLLEACSFVEKDAVFSGIEIVTDLAADLPAVSTDRAQLQQVFLNLATNALDAVGEGGRVILTSRLEGEFVVVSVTDNGPGIKKEVQDRIFDPFFTTKEPGQGTGLGLSISYSIMQRLGGSLTFVSRPGQGTTFTVKIPRGFSERA
jgi:two-component system NtrC family sensor kinase